MVRIEPSMRAFGESDIAPTTFSGQSCSNSIARFRRLSLSVGCDGLARDDL
jgi:hypothetical protein